MKDLVIKADRMVLNLLTKYVRRWVERHDEEKHKVDFMILMEWIQLGALIVWAIVIPSALYVVQGSITGAAVHATIWSLLGVMEWFGIQMTIVKIKPTHDFLFSLRKNPDFVAQHHEMLDKLFVEMRRKRLEQTAILIGMTAVLFAVFTLATPGGDPNNLVWQYLLVNSIANALKRYILYVDDMTQPKKEKKASAAISEMVARLWGELTAGFLPQPTFV